MTAVLVIKFMYVSIDASPWVRKQFGATAYENIIFGDSREDS